MEGNGAADFGNHRRAGCYTQLSEYPANVSPHRPVTDFQDFGDYLIWMTGGYQSYNFLLPRA
jgi:hypothetical protein